ncbi:MAG: hypothetical protein P8J61_10125 [Gammaproteobacteria bacterium]|jgi:hypothetical protein|nr:hypothetical protein [Gammaproteobacteria bacterium]
MQANHTNKKKIGLGIIMVSLVWLMQPLAHAQSDSELIDAVRTCQNVEGLSGRLACYDQVLPPGTASIGNISPVVENNVSTRTSTAPASREAELEAEVADLEQQLMVETSDILPTAQIVEVQRPSVRTSRLIAADGRVFVESNSTTIVRWPDTPFNIEVNTGRTGTITLRALDVDRDRGQGRGIRVALER